MKGRGEIIAGREKNLCKGTVVRMRLGNRREAGVAGGQENGGTWHQRAGEMAGPDGRTVQGLSECK